MIHIRRHRARGFALLEALIALVLILVGLVAVSKLQSISLIGAGEARARAEAAHLTQQKLEQLRNMVQKGEFTALADGSDLPVAGVNATFTTFWTVVPNSAVPPLEQHEVRVWTTWTDSRGTAQRFDLDTVVAWDEAMASAYASAGGAGNPVAPTGQALRGGALPDGTSVTPNHDGTEIHFDPVSKNTYLVKDGKVILTLPPDKEGNQQHFVRISGRVVFDNAVLEAIFKDKASDPVVTENKVFVRLSSEGECIYDNKTLKTDKVLAAYKYFDYTCYEGVGWYGNVSVSTSGTTKENPAVCVGDPSYTYTGTDADLPKASPKAHLSNIREYRGFHPNAKGQLISTGMPSGAEYGTTLDKDGTPEAGPFAGMPKPSALSAHYSSVPVANSAGDYLIQDFMLKDPKTTSICDSTTMPAAIFKFNAGAFVCISPNQRANPGECPDKWPGYDTVQDPEGDTCTFVFDSTATGKPNRIEITYADAPGTPIEGVSCNVSGGNVANYDCTVPEVPADKLGSATLVFTRWIDPKKKNDPPAYTVGSPTPYPLPAACPATSIPLPLNTP